MGNQVKRIGVLTSGGDAPGMNAAVRAVVRTAVNRGIECIGIRRGWNGLINHDFIRMDSNSVSHIIDKGGTMLYTARSEEFMTPEGCWDWTASWPSAATAPSGGPWPCPASWPSRGRPFRWWASPPPSTTTSAAPTIPSALTPPATRPSSVWISCGTPCSPTSAARWWRSWAATPVIWPCMWASPWVPRRCSSPSGRWTLTGTWWRRSVRPACPAPPTIWWWWPRARAVPWTSASASMRSWASTPGSPCWATSSGAVPPPPGTGRPPAAWAMRRCRAWPRAGATASSAPRRARWWTWTWRRPWP